MIVINNESFLRTTDFTQEIDKKNELENKGDTQQLKLIDIIKLSCGQTENTLCKQNSVRYKKENTFIGKP